MSEIQSNIFVSTIVIEDDKALMIREGKDNYGQRGTWNFPSGHAELGESLTEAAIRETLEETGYEVGMVKHLGDLYKGAYTNTLRSYSIAYDCIPSELGQDLDDTEFIEPVLVTVEELFDLARKQAMTDTEALFLAYDELQLVREGP